MSGRRQHAFGALLVGLALAVVGCRRPDAVVEGAVVPARDAQATASPRVATRAKAPRPGYAHDYTFTEDWFSRRIPVWKTLLDHLRGKPHISYLEIGVFEGRSALWMLENELTHPTSRATTIDIASNENYTRNLKLSGLGAKVTNLIGPSQTKLRELPLESFDIIYVDGGHSAMDVYSDAAQSWLLLKPGGILIFDDYRWLGVVRAGNRPLPREWAPALALDAFLSAYGHSLTVLHCGYQLAVRKEEDRCGTGGPCSVLGSYRYWWSNGTLTRAGQTDPVQISTAERALIETLAQSERLGHTGITPTSEQRATPVFKELDRRLQLGL